MTFNDDFWRKVRWEGSWQRAGDFCWPCPDWLNHFANAQTAVSNDHGTCEKNERWSRERADFAQHVSSELRGSKGLFVLRGLDLGGGPVQSAEAKFRAVYANLGGTQICSTFTDGAEHALMSSLQEPGIAAQDRHRKFALTTRHPHVQGVLCVVRSECQSLGRFCSVSALYGYIREEAPQFLPALKDGFFYALPADAVGRHYTRQKVPVFSFSGAHIQGYYSRSSIEQAAKLTQTSLSGDLVDAMDFLDELMASPEFCLNAMMAEGDCAFWNTRKVLAVEPHRCTGYGTNSSSIYLGVSIRHAQLAPGGIVEARDAEHADERGHYWFSLC